MFSLSFARAPSSQGLRPADLRWDLDGIAELLDLAFVEERRLPWGQPGSDFRSLRGLGPLLWLLRPLFPQLAGLFQGFVWVEEGKIVGNISLSCLPTPHCWLISNVAVHPRFRRRGIARLLTQAALDYARQHGGEQVVLDVRPDNTPAAQLYRSLGFQWVDGVTELRLDPPQRPPRPAAFASSVQPLPRGHWHLVEQLAQVALPQSSPGLALLSPRDYLPPRFAPLAWWFSAFLFGQGDTQYALFEGEDLLGWVRLHLYAGWRSHRLSLLVHPAAQGRVEEALLVRALAHLPRLSSAAVVSKIPASHANTVAALEQYGFRIVETLHRLALSLS